MISFQKILIPVDFTINTTVAVSRAIDLAAPGTSIELVHISEATGTALTKLQQIACEIKYAHGLDTTTHAIKGTKIGPGLIRFVKASNPDLIVIGKNNHHSFFSFRNTIIPVKIAEITKRPVLTVKPGSLRKRIDTVVMPVCEYFPDRKLELLARLNQKAELNVHLLTILDNHQHQNNYAASALLQTMKTIRGKIKCNVQHNVIHSNNKVVATLQYAENIGADVLLLSPDTETTINTWISKKDITDVVSPSSQLQILSIQPH